MVGLKWILLDIQDRLLGDICSSHKNESTIRVIMSPIVNQAWPLHQLDFENAFLNGELEEEVYMSLPPRFKDNYRRKNVCRLK